MIYSSPEQPAIEPPITSSPWWPEIDPAQIREAQRIDATITAPRLKSALIEAIATTNNALLAWRSARQAAGFATLDAVPAEAIDGTSQHVHRYLRAVGCLAKALLLERHRDYDSAAGTDRLSDAKNETLASTIDDCRRDHLHALADITGRTRSTVELI